MNIPQIVIGYVTTLFRLKIRSTTVLFKESNNISPNNSLITAVSLRVCLMIPMILNLDLVRGGSGSIEVDVRGQIWMKKRFSEARIYCRCLVAWQWFSLNTGIDSVPAVMSDGGGHYVRL